MKYTLSRTPKLSSNGTKYVGKRSSEKISKASIKTNHLIKSNTGPSHDNKHHGHTLFITGATGEFAPGLIERAIRRGISTIACSRTERHSINPQRLQWIQVPEDQIGNSDAWNEHYQRLASKSERVSVINLIGTAVPPPGKTLEDVNVKPVMAAHQGLQNFARENPEITVSMVHISSICASVLGDAHEYSAMRKYVDEAVTTTTDRINAVVFRPGLIFNDLGQNNMVNMGHPWSPEQFASLPLHPVIGSGNQIQQPVYQGDLSDAIINATYANEDRIIDAVGPEVMSQAEMFKFFVHLGGGTFRPVHIPYGFGEVMAKHYPMGRIAPYSIAAFEKLDNPNDQPFPTDPFEEFVGHNLTSMSDVYYHTNPEDGPIILARPPIARHINQIIKKMIRDSEARNETLKALSQYGWTITKDIAKSLRSN